MPMGISMKKILSLLSIICIIALLFSGCQKKEAGGGSGTDKFVTVNFAIFGSPPENDTISGAQGEWNKYLKEKVNANLEIKWIDWSDWSTKYNLMLASGEELDLITTSSTWLDLWPNAERGAFMDITEMVEKYAPETYKNVTPEQWEECKFEGKIIAIPENELSATTSHGFAYRGDWAKEAGFLDGLKGFSDVEKYLDYIKAQKPDIYPWDRGATANEYVTGFMNDNSDAIELLGVPVFMGKSYSQPYEIFEPYFSDEFMDFAVMMKKWADKGFWRKDVLNYSGNSRELFQAGQTALFQHHASTYLGVKTEMEEKLPGSDAKFYGFGESRDNMLAKPITHGTLSIGTNSKNPERALMVYDLIRNDEKMYRLFNYGREGVNYIINSDGKSDRPEGFDETKHSYGLSFWSGRRDVFDLPSVRQWSGWNTVVEKYVALEKTNPYGRFVFKQDAVVSEFNNIQEILNRNVPAIAGGVAGDPEKAVQSLQAQLKQAGYDKLLKEVSEQLKKYGSQ